MTPAMKKPLLLALLAGGLSLGAFAPALQAQPLPSPEQRWYQVEVILFAQSDSFGNEKNLKSVRLGYPRPLVFLDAPIDVAPETLARLSAQDLQLYLAMVPETLLQRRDPTVPVPFATLPPEAHLLTAEARNLERSGSYQVLFHQAWRQTLDGPRHSPWVLVSGGAPVGDHHELEGSLRIYTDTQIVAQTNLWRTRFGQAAFNQSTFDQSASDQLGSDQLGSDQKASPTASGTIATPGNDAMGHSQGNGDGIARDVIKNQPSGAAGWPALPPAPRAPEPQLPPLFRETPSAAAFAVDTRDTAALQPARHTPAVVDIDRFETSQIINARELHYLDHPRLGALIRVTPYDPEQREEALIDDLSLEGDVPDLEAPLPEIDDELRD